MQQLQKCFGSIFPEAGCDEAGRGCLAGPVVAAAVILNPDISIDGLNDSKKLSENRRIELKYEIVKFALSWGVAFVDNIKIDEVNILNASILAMHNAIYQLVPKPKFIIVDGNRFHQYENISHKCIVKGDAKFQSIAAASVLAKVFRDEYMILMDKKYPQYKWRKNKGYPTIEHKKAIRKYGITEIHRKTFSSSIQMKLF